MAQVEVLRGPQGTLFGQGVDFADKGTAGSEVGELVLNGGFNLPLGQTLALRVASQYKKETGLQRSATTGEDNEIEDFGVRARLLFEPSDTVSVSLSAEHGQQQVDGQTFFALAIAPNSTTPLSPIPAQFAAPVYQRDTASNGRSAEALLGPK